MTLVLAHQGGWDELLISLGTLGGLYVIAFGIAKLKERRSAEPSAGTRIDHRTRLEERRRINDESRRQAGSGEPKE